MFARTLIRQPIMLLAVACACAGTTARPRMDRMPTAEGLSPDKPRAVVAQFVGRVQSGDFESAYALLAEPLRARYTPARLREDFQRDPLARTRLEALRRAAISGAPVVDDQGASFRLENGGVARLVREGKEFRISSLE